MLYTNTNGSERVDLRQAVEHCYAPDNGLYMPERIPVLPRAYFNNIEQMSLTDIGYIVMSTLMGDHLSPTELKDVVDMAFDFAMPVVDIPGGMYALEMFHGPTMAFKDVGARFLTSFVSHFHGNNKPVAILVATTGNTGGAVANALSGIKGVEVLVLFPRGTLSRAQQAQFSTAGSNVYPIEVSGTISQCRRMVKEAITDPDNDCWALKPVCANTQNILRIMPQVVFFFHAYARLRNKIGAAADGFTVSIPCGNLSNLTAAVIARRMGLPMGRIIAGCNANDDFVRVLDGSMDISKVNRTARPTLAWAMDSGYPANLPRLLALYGGDIKAMSADIAAASIDDDTIADTINNSIAEGYTPDPHTAVAIAAARVKAPSDRPVVVLATAHPAKSLDKMTAVTGRAVELPLQMTRFMSRPVVADKLAPTYAALKKYILNPNK